MRMRIVLVDISSMFVSLPPAVAAAAATNLPQVVVRFTAADAAAAATAAATAVFVFVSLTLR